jgi:RND family efflux transporter MFP subunit
MTTMRIDALRSRPAALAAATLLAAAGAAWLLAGDARGNSAAAGPAAPPPAPVEVAAARGSTLPAVASVPGTVVGRNDARIAAEVTGRLAWVADVGTEVAPGGALARLDARELELALAQAEATARRLAAALELADAQAQRTAEVARQGLVSRAQLDEAALRRDMAEQELAQARVARDQAAYRRERAVVRAPFGGRVAERIRQPGEFLAAGGEVVRLVDTRRVEVVAQAPLGVARFVRAGQQVVVDDDGGRATGKIRAVVPVGDDRSRMIEVRVAIDAAHRPIGTAVRVALPQSAPREAVMVDRDALVVREDGIFVWKVADDGTAVRIAVTTGTEQDHAVEVFGEVLAGDRIVVRGAERLAPGQAVTVRPG